MKKRFWLLPVIASWTIATPLTACAKKEELPTFDFDTIRSTYHDIILNTIPVEQKYLDRRADQIITQELDAVTLTGVLDHEYDTYKFKNIDYWDMDHATWPAHRHIELALQIAIAGVWQKDDAKMDIAVKLTYFWIANVFINWNWWFNTIGVPRDFSNLALFIFEKLSPRGQERLLEIIQRGSFMFNEDTHTATGANLFWYGEITMKSAILKKNNEEMQMMLDYVINEIKEDDYEGFQHDGTFFQHGREIYNGGYGRQGSTFLCKILAAFSKTDYQWPQEKIDILANYIVNGIKYTTHKGQFDYLVMGRALCRKQAGCVDGSGTDLGNVYHYKYLTALPNCPKKDEINTMLYTLEHKTDNFEGIKCFPMSSYITMNVGDGIYMSFKGVTDTLVNSETANAENILGHNFSYGANTCVMETGAEYQDISPVWKYDRLPGTTSIDENDFLLKEYNDHDFKAPADSKGPYFCGETDGVTFCMQKAYHGYRRGDEQEGELPKDRVNYTITCFATENGMVILGSDIKFVGNQEKTLHTTVEQCIQTGTVSYDNKTVHHGKVIYKNIDTNSSSEFITKTEEREESWHRNKDSYDEEDTSQATILSIEIDSNDKSQYAYSIQPQSKATFDFVVASNTADIQAVDIGNNRIAVACYKPGSFEYLGNSYTIPQTGYSVIQK